MSNFLAKQPNEQKALGLLIVIVILASVLRLYGLDNQSLWTDELLSWQYGKYDSLSEVIQKGVIHDVHPPGYEILLHLTIKYLGDSEFSLRLPSAVAGILTVVLIFFMARHFYTWREGLIASALMAFLWCPIYYSQEVRAYSILLLFTMLTTYFWMLEVQYFRRNEKIPWPIICCHAASAIVSAYIHYFGLYLVCLQALIVPVLIFLKPKAWVSAVLPYFIVLIAYLPWLPSFFDDLSRGDTLTPKPGLRDIYRLFLFYFNWSLGLLGIVVALYLFLLLHDIYIAGQKEKTEDKYVPMLSPDWLLLYWLVVPIMGALMKSMISAPVFTSRNLIISLPAAYLLLARAITRLPVRPRYQAIATCLLVALFLKNLVLDRQHYSKPHKMQLREAIEYITADEDSLENSLIIGYGTYGCEYYFARSGTGASIDIRAGHRDDIPKIREMIAAEAPEHIWFMRVVWPLDSEFMSFLEKNFRRVKHGRFLRTDVWLFENDARPSAHEISGPTNLD